MSSEALSGAEYQAGQVAAVLENKQSEKRQKIWNRLMGFGFGGTLAGVGALFGGAALATVEPVSGTLLFLSGVAAVNLGPLAGITGVIGKVADRPTNTIVVKEAPQH